jgi:hypothetical protein
VSIPTTAVIPSAACRRRTPGVVRLPALRLLGLLLTLRLPALPA